ncbi:MAG: hypothetical protein JNM59_01470 [Hyphomonadaceae bacterium]|nr:hypothetical protein [Hyphomonadaceae bacterium]
MPLIDIWRNNKDSIRSYAVRQVVAIAGDGRLRDGSECAAEFRTYLRETGSDKLAAYARECLEEAFDDSGLVLQDVINEVGRRLEFDVEDGRYRSGGRTEIAFDGIWRAGQDQAILVEVKTTDTYNVRLDSVAEYRTSLVRSGRLPETASALFVVGRKDTGALEAQIRGSPYAWDMRVVGVDSLIKLMQVKEKSTADRTIRQIRELLRPFEYTRVDRIVDVVFETASDVEQTSESASIEAVGQNEGEVRDAAFTSPEQLNAMRERIVVALSARFSSGLVRRRQALYETADQKRRVSISISKRYNREYQPYWYAFHPSWEEFLLGAEEGVHVLGCMDLDRAFVIPLATLQTFLPKLNQTTREDKTYWHLVITTLEGGELALYSSRTGENIPLSPFAMAV